MLRTRIVSPLLALCSALVFAASVHAAPLLTGAERPELYLPRLQGKHVGLVVNQTSRVGDQHLIDFLRARGVAVTRIFALEHGVRGNVENGGHVAGGVDGPSGLPLVSLYGSHHAPTARDLQGIDQLVFDIQDVGVRFYTFISSLHYLMQSCADYDVPLLVLDRPNPNGDYIDGPLLEAKFRSFVGVDPLPLVHGLTVGELARMIDGEGWLEHGAHCELAVIPVAGYRKSMHYALPVKPSPNLPNDLAIRLYPSLALFEGTDVSIGRGTDFPFQVIGHPVDTRGTFKFSPHPIAGASENPKHSGEPLRGDDLRGAAADARFTLDYLIDWSTRTGQTPQQFFARPEFFDKLAGTDKLRLAIERGASAAQIRRSWQADLQRFREQRKPYLIYAEH